MTEIRLEMFYSALESVTALVSTSQNIQKTRYDVLLIGLSCLAGFIFLICIGLFIFCMKYGPHRLLRNNYRDRIYNGLFNFLY